MTSRPRTSHHRWIAIALIWLQLLLPVLGHALPGLGPVSTGAAGLDMAEFCTMLADPAAGPQAGAPDDGGQLPQPGTHAGGCAQCCPSGSHCPALPAHPAPAPTVQADPQAPACATSPAPRPARPLQHAAARAPPATA